VASHKFGDSYCFVPARQPEYKHRLLRNETLVSFSCIGGVIKKGFQIS
jgi:hypothetical protein